MSSRLVKGAGPEAEEIFWRSADHGLHSASQALAPSTAAVVAGSQDQQQEVTELKKLLTACQQQADSRAQEAHQKGVQLGLQQGETNIRQQLGTQHEASLQRLARTIEEISGMRQRCRYAAEQDVVKLALAIARRVLHREMAIDPSAILGLVKAALGSLDVRELHRVRIHPAQAVTVRKQLEGMGLPQRCEIVADPSLELGGAILETSHGSLDASTATQLDEIERGFADLVKQAT